MTSLKVLMFFAWKKVPPLSSVRSINVDKKVQQISLIIVEGFIPSMLDLF